MAVLEIVRMGHPVLRAPAAPVPASAMRGAAFARLVDDMVETMRAEGGVGLAAPQVGIGWRLFVLEVSGPGPEAIPLRVVVNPELTPEPGEPVEDWEGCLSIPDLRGLVPRHHAVRVHALDRHGAPSEYRVEGFEARIVQHENDHLDGVLFLDRMRDLRSLAFYDEWHRYVLGSAGSRAERPE
ncbi:MAG TPA: peptide deformylase [Thermoanaerobaculia bacterium]|nr:peptide deformylase [Thermoanaerobaculia bacterium]